MTSAELVVSLDRDAIDWAALAINSLLAIAAVCGFLFSYFQYRGERTRREQAETRAEQAEAKGEIVEQAASEEVKRAQARLVTSWIMNTTERGPDAAELHVRNGSDMPVFNVQLCKVDAAGKIYRQSLGMIAPLETRSQRSFGADNVLLKGSAIPQAISFEDSANRHWFRDFYGELHPSPPVDTPDWEALMLTKATPPFPQAAAEPNSDHT